MKELPILTDLVEPMLPVSYRVQKVVQETEDTFTLELRPADGGHGLSFTAGQFNMLYVFGVGEVPISISGDPTKTLPLVHTTRAVGAVTKALRKLKRGDMLGIRGPFGKPWPIEDVKGNDILIVAGGIGLAPLRPVLYYVLANRESFGKIVLLYGTRTPQDLLFGKELEQWKGRFDIEVGVTVDRATSNWRGNVGVVTRLISRAPIDPDTTIAMVCGPEVMMRFTVLELQKRGLTDQHIFVSMERNMKCGNGLCGHCQLGSTFICKDGPVFRYDAMKDLIVKHEI